MGYFLYVDYFQFTPLVRKLVQKLYKEGTTVMGFCDQSIPKGLYQGRSDVFCVYKDKTYENNADGSRDPIFVVTFDEETLEIERTDIVENILLKE